MRPSRVGLALVLAAAAVLRFWELGHGIPHAIDTEEPEIVGRAFQMMRAGVFNPEFFDYGSLHITLQYAVSVFRFVAGSMSGEWYSLDTATSHGFYLWGRAVIAMLGVATVFLVFQIGMRWGARHALLAAAIVAVAPTHVHYSHLAVPIVLFTFCITLTTALTLRATEKGTLAAFIAAGIVVGLAAGTRYSGAVAIVMPLAACWMAPVVRPNRVTASIAVLVAAAVAFFFAAPYTFLDLPGFLDRFAQLAAAHRETGSGGSRLLPLQAVQMQFAWPTARGPMLAVGWPAMLLIAAGLVMAVLRAVRGPGHVRWTIIVSFLAAYGAMLFWLPPKDERFILPVLPSVALLASAAVISGVSLLRRYQFPRAVRTALIAALTLAVLLPGAVSAVRYAMDRSKQSTVDLAYSWIQQNLGPDTVVVVEASALSIPRGVVEGRGVPELRLKPLEDYSSEGVQYLIASSTAYGKYVAEPRTYREEYRDYTRLFSETREVARFAPSRRHPGPELRVLQVVP